MISSLNRVRAWIQLLLCSMLVALGQQSARAGDAAALISQSIASNQVVNGRSIFTQRWTVQNTGTTTWSTTSSGYTMNLISKDSLGAIQFYNTTSGSRYTISAVVDSGRNVPPGAANTFTMMFIAPEAAGTYTDTFQLNNASGVYFGPAFSVQVVVQPTGPTNQYDRCMAVSYANNYAGVICSDGYFWTNGSDYGHYGTNVSVPTTLIGDDCAHFVSCCIGSEPNRRGGGMTIRSRVPPTYGEPSAPDIVNNILIGCGYAEEVSSLSQMEPGDVVGWNWEGNTNIADLDHVTMYLGNGLLAAHAASCLDVSATNWYQSSEPSYVRHLIHIFDSPTLNMTAGKGKMVFSWTTNWSAYTLQWSGSMGNNAVWSNVPVRLGKAGISNFWTNTSLGSSAQFFKLTMP